MFVLEIIEHGKMMNADFELFGQFISLGGDIDISQGMTRLVF